MTPPTLPPESQRAVTQERLRLLSMGFYISGAIGAVFVSFLLIHFSIFTALSFMPSSSWNKDYKVSAPGVSTSEQIEKQNAVHPDMPPVIIFRVLAGVFGFIILVGWTLGGLTIYAGRCIKKRQRRTFVMVVGAINCLWIPYGTLLGVATFLVLEAPDTKEEYPG